MSDKPSIKMSRRSIVKALGAATLAAPVVWTSKVFANTRQLVVRDPGNPYTKAFQDTLYGPFEKATGIHVVGVVAGIDPVAQVKTIVDTKNYIWDGMILGESAAELLGGMGYLDEHKLQHADNVKELPPEYVTPYTVGSNVSATSVVYRTSALGTKGPQSWQDFWDVEHFPGRRSLFKYARYTMEQALLADGVAPEHLYPLDLDRAFRSLDRIKNHVDVWWSGGAQIIQLLTGGEVDMMGALLARALAAEPQGTPITVSWNNFLWQMDGWAMPKGGPKADMMREFMQFSCAVAPQAALPNYIPAGPVNLAAYAHIKPEVAALLTTSPEHRAKGVHQDAAYWVKNGNDVQQRFNAWFIQ